MTTRVLLVDDEPAILGPLRHLIEHTRPDTVVVYASDVRTALWQIRSTAIRMVLTDLRMQNDDQAGWAVVNAARQADVAVAVMTSTDDAEQLAKLAEAGVTVLHKSAITRDRLAEIIDRCFAESPSQRDHAVESLGGPSSGAKESAS